MALATVLGLQFFSFFGVGPERSIMASNWCFEDDDDEQVEVWVREGAGGAECVAFEPGWMFVSTADHQCLTLVVWCWLERERV